MLSHRTFRGLAKWGLLLGGFVATAALGCGGQAKSDAFSDDDSGTSGGSGGTAAGGAPSTAVSVTSGPSTTATATTAGGGNGGAPDRCSLPLEGGNCEAAIPSWGYSTETSRCEQFTYGGCDGNDNRFESLDACLAACVPGGREACEHSTDCVIDHGCCGFCEETDPANLVAVNQKYATFQALDCGSVDCEHCPPIYPFDSYGARCNGGTCEVYDVRKTPLSECSVNDDCRMRAGLACCEGCVGETRTQWVSVSKTDRVEQELCSEIPGPCPTCVPPSPGTLIPLCGEDGHCTYGALL